MPAGAIDAGLIKETLSDVLPDGMRPIKSDGVRLLNFDDASAALALDAEHMPGDFGEPALLDRQRRLSSCARIAQDSVPKGIGHGIARCRIGRFGRSRTRSLAHQLFHLLWGRHSPACGSLIRHERIRTKREHFV